MSRTVYDSGHECKVNAEYNPIRRHVEGVIGEVCHFCGGIIGLAEAKYYDWKTGKWSDQPIYDAVEKK